MSFQRAILGTQSREPISNLTCCQIYLSRTIWQTYLSVFVFQLLVSGHLNIEESQLTKTIQRTVSFGKHKQFSNSVSVTRQYFKTLTSYWPKYLSQGALDVIILLKTIILDPVVPPISWDSVSKFLSLWTYGSSLMPLCHIQLPFFHF